MPITSYIIRNTRSCAEQSGVNNLIFYSCLWKGPRPMTKGHNMPVPSIRRMPFPNFDWEKICAFSNPRLPNLRFNSQCSTSKVNKCLFLYLWYPPNLPNFLGSWHVKCCYTMCRMLPLIIGHREAVFTKKKGFFQSGKWIHVDDASVFNQLLNHVQISPSSCLSYRPGRPPWLQSRSIRR